MLHGLAQYLKLHGIRYTFRHALEKGAETYLGTFDRRFHAMDETEEERALERDTPVPVGGFSVLIPVYNPKPAYLEALLESLLAQTCADWEACIVNTGDSEAVRSLLDRYAARESRIRVAHRQENLGISGNTNAALRMAGKAWIVLCDHDDLLLPSALWHVARTIEEKRPDVVYTDEDKVREDGRMHTDPHLKPDFAPDTLCSSNYVCHLLAVRRELMEAVGGERSEFDGSQDHDLMLRLSEHTDSIAHLPMICYSWRTVGTSASHTNLMRCMLASCRATEEHMARRGYPVKAVPDRDVLRLTYEIPRSLRVEAFVDATNEACRTDLSQVRALELTVTPITLDDAENRYATMNRAAAASDADVLLFVDGSVRHLSEHTVRELLMYAQREDVGAVTPCLLDRRGHVRHAGFAYPLTGFARCRQEGLKLGAGGYHILLRQAHNVGAVSGVCFMIRRDHWLWMDESYHGGLGMVDFCIRLTREGLHHVYTPHGALVCRPSAWLLPGTRRDAEDLRRIQTLYPSSEDPCYHPAFRRDRADFRVTDQIRDIVKRRQEMTRAYAQSVGTGT